MDKQNGKGDRSRNNFSESFRNNFDQINWKRDLRKRKIFYFTTRDPKLQGDFLEVSMLIGLRNVFGDSVIDVPRKNVIYGDFSESPKEALHGRGFTYYRGDVKDIDSSLRNLKPEKNDIIIYGTVEYGILSEKRDHGNCENVFYLDGGDVQDIRIKPCFKRELFSEQDGVIPTGFGIPKSEILPVNFNYKGDQLIPQTTPDTDLISEFGTKPKVHFHPTMSRYFFEDEDDYVRDICRSWFFPVTKRGGWDSLRPYQGVAYGTLVVFKDYGSKPKLCSPQDFPCYSYSNVQDLKELMSRLVSNRKPSSEYYSMLASQRNWLNAFGTCEARAKKLVNDIESLIS